MISYPVSRIAYQVSGIIVIARIYKRDFNKSEDEPDEKRIIKRNRHIVLRVLSETSVPSAVKKD